jgi:hypothetical protein
LRRPVETVPSPDGRGASISTSEAGEGLFREAQHPAGHHDGDGVVGKIKDQRVHDLIFGERHLRTLLARYAAHYNGGRPHRALQLRPPRPDHPALAINSQRIRRRPVLGGLISEYGAPPNAAGQYPWPSLEPDKHQDPVSWVGYLAAPDFWGRTFPNWQSEMLAVGSMAVLSVYLRQRGSPESKPVGAAHDNIGQTG